MATHSSFLALEIPWTEEPSMLPSMGSQRVGRDLVTKQQQMYYEETFLFLNVGQGCHPCSSIQGSTSWHFP